MLGRAEQLAKRGSVPAGNASAWVPCCGPGDAAIREPDRAKEASKVDAPSDPLPRTWLRHDWIRLPAIRDTDWVDARFGHN